MRKRFCAAFVLASVLATGAPAFAATQTTTNPVKLTGSVTKNLFNLESGVCDGCAPDALFNISGIDDEEFGVRATVGADAEMKWTANNSITTTYDDALIRQGSTLNASNTFTAGAGSINASVTLNAAVILVAKHPTLGNGVDWVDTTTKLEASPSVDIDIPCAIPLPGESPRHCEKTHSITLIDATLGGLLGLKLDLQLFLAIDVSGSGVITIRKIGVVGSNTPASPDATLEFEPASPDTVADNAPLSCGVPAESPLNYGLTGISYSTGPSAFSTGARLVLVPVVIVDLDSYTLAEVTFPLGSLPGFQMTADAINIALGNLKPDNAPPVAVAGGPYSGSEGTAVTFDGSASSDNCGFPTLKWEFSDGGVAFGPNPQHVFADNGVYSGLLTATDPTGNTSTTTFSVTISNVAPVADAGPDTSGLWGVPIALNGAGTDKGAADQSTLVYEWNFGDGTPSATGGGSVTHSYANPGSYTATLTVCDKNGACHNDSATVVVNKRSTSIGIVGATTGTFDTASTLAASLVDQTGAAVNARSVTFTIAGETDRSGETSSSGRAEAAYTPTLAAGTVASGASFAGDSHYTASSTTGSFTVGAKATTVTYTGSLTGGPNKTITLSAKLVDATGKNLAGRTINFALGTQSASATTDANGVAATSLKLTQKNGTYTVSATFTPAGADVGRLVSSSNSATFKLQAK